MNHFNKVVGVLLDSADRIKMHHWNLVGPRFFFLHEKLDDLEFDLRSYADYVAEHSRYLDNFVYPVREDADAEWMRLISEDSIISEVGTMLGHLDSLLDEVVRYFSDEPSTQDVFIEVQRRVQLWLWQFKVSSFI